MQIRLVSKVFTIYCTEMVASKLSSFLNLKDKNNVVVASWAEGTGKDGVARCKYCHKEVKFAAGSSELLKHSMTAKHITSTPKDNVLKQMSINEALAQSRQEENQDLKERERTQEFEISLARCLSRHNITAEFIECLQRQLKMHCKDSVVVQRMKISKTKCEVMIREGIAATYREETIKMLQKCDAYSLGFDESEVNKISELEMMVQISSPTGLVLRHYRTLDLEDGTAETITQTLLSQLDEDAIDYKKKLLSAMTDGCNVMQGRLGGVKVLLSKEIPELLDPGSCNDHHLSNAMKHAVTKFDPDIEKALVNVYLDIGGQKGRGLKRKKAFEKICNEVGISPLPLKRFCSTRFRAIRTCLRPVLYNWNALNKFYSNVKKPTPRQKLLQDYFVAREMMSYLNMNFVYSSTREIDEAIDHFEKRTTLIYGAREKMEKILRSSIMKFHNETSVKRIDDDENVEKKSGVELLDFDVDNAATMLGKRKVVIGEEAKQFINELSLDPKSPQLSKFFENVHAFHRTVVLKYQHYFQKGLKCTELDYISALNPKKFNAVTTAHYIKYLAKKFTKIVKNIEPIEGQDRMFEEVDEYTIDEDVKALSQMEFEEFWLAVSKLTEGGWERYKILPRFALAFGTMFNSNSESERAFSVQTDIHRNPKKNLMNQETFDGHMQVHFGVEGKEVKKLCSTCLKHENASTADNKSTPHHHCHCSVAPIDQQMKDTCKRMWELNQIRVDKSKIGSDVDKEKEKEANAEFTKRKLTFVTGLKTRSTFYSPALMSPVFFEKLDDETADLTSSKKKKSVPNEQASSSKETLSKKSTKKNKKRKASDDAEQSVSLKKLKKVAKDVPISLFKKK